VTVRSATKATVVAFAAAAASLIGLGAGLDALAQGTFPSKNIHLIVGNAAGGGTDYLARLLGQKMSERLGQAVVIENKPGANSTIAVQAVAKAPPDGHTLLMGSIGMLTVNPAVVPNLLYDTKRDLAPISIIGSFPLILTVSAASPIRSVQELIAYAKANPDKVSYAGAGAGTTPDLTGGEFARRAGLDKLVFVPFRGTAPATAAVIGGDVQLTFVSMGPHIEFIRNGTLRVLAAATPQRRPYVPDVATFAEQGFPNFEMSTWFSLFAPKGTPKEIVDQLNLYTREVQAEPEARKRLEATFIDPLALTQSEFATLVKADAVKYERIVREQGIKLE